MSLKGYLLDASNNAIKIANWISAALTPSTGIVEGLPYGDTVGDGSGTVAIKTLTIGSAAGAGSALGPKNGLYSTLNAGAATNIGVARTNRFQILIQNEGTGTDAIRVGLTGDAISTTIGILLKAGEWRTFDSQGQWQVVAVTGTPKVSAYDEFN